MPLTTDELKSLSETAASLRKDVIDITGWSGGAHIGGALSMMDILVILYHKYMNIDPSRPDWEDRDRFVLSKGHGGVGYAPVLARKGYFAFEALKEFNRFKSAFGMHLDSLKVTGVDASTGSLGHGLPQAVGFALASRVLGKSWRTYCLLGDGECNEGSIWEAAMAAANFKLTDLITIVDRNRLMIDGKTEDVMRLEPLADKWTAFGFSVQEVNGHNFEELAEAIEFAHGQTEKPVLILANTVKGKGVDFMENDVKWHYGGLSTDLIDKAKACVDQGVSGERRPS